MTNVVNKVIESGEFFFSRGKFKEWVISENVISSMKEMIPQYYDGAYVHRGLEFNLDSNISIIDKYRGYFDRDAFMSQVALSMQLLVRTVKMEHLKKYKVELKDYHIGLLNRLYIDYDISEKSINSGDKRPFGNSYIEGDILEVYKSHEYSNISELEGDKLDKYLEDNNIDIWNVYDEVIELAKYVISKYPIPFKSFTYYGNDDSDLSTIQYPYYNHSWAPSLFQFRDIKIEQILR